MKEVDAPALLDVHDHWDRVRGEKFAPSRREFRLEDLPPRIVPFMVLVDILGPPLDFHYRFFGGKMVEVSGVELTGKTYYADRIEGYGFANAKLLPVMMTERVPMFTRTRWISVRGVPFQTITVRLPLSENGKSTTGGATVNRFTPI